MGKKISGEIPREIYEHYFYEHYGWEPEVVHRLSERDAQRLLRVIMSYEYAEKDFQMQLAGAKSNKSGKNVVKQSFNPETNQLE